jgi:hypothetical protein
LKRRQATKLKHHATLCACVVCAGEAAAANAQSEHFSRQDTLQQGHLCQLPSSLQLQLQLLQCMHTIVQHLPADLPLPRGLGCALLEQLLLPASVLHQEVAHLQQPERLLGLWIQQRQHLSMQVSLRGCARCLTVLDV